MNALKEIAETWKLEAKQENNLRYFFHIEESQKILNGDKFYIIGRKGSGKSAISQYILNLCQQENAAEKRIYTEQLSFKNFPFNDLYALQNGKYTQPNQYITIWKYIIYSCICRLMVQNDRINSDLRKVLQNLYPPTTIKSLARLIDNWTTKEFGIQVLGSGGNIKIDKMSKFQSLSWIEKTNILEDIIDEYIDDSNYYIVFDELDEDYRNFESSQERSQYIYLITSLFKAVQDIKSIFKDRKQVICPIVFLRDDIYLLIKDTDKNKWGDFKIALEWDEEKLRAMLAYRISKAIDEKGGNIIF